MSELAISSTHWLAISLRNGAAIIFDLNQSNRWQFLKSIETKNPTSNGNNDDDDDLNRNLIKFSPDGQRLIVNGQSKQINIYKCSNDSWQLERIVQVKKRASAIDLNDNVLLIADKSGDVYKVQLSNGTESNNTITLTADDCLMGHLSMLLEIVLVQTTDQQSFILTGDRDEKIRLSHYPNAYNIQGYCLGHTEFVSHVKLIGNDQILSASGDGTLRLWQLPDCKPLEVFYSNDLINGAKRRSYPSSNSNDESDPVSTDYSSIDLSIWKMDVTVLDSTTWVTLSIYAHRSNSIYFFALNQPTQTYQLVFNSQQGNIIDYCFSSSKDLIVLFDNFRLIQVDVQSVFNNESVVCSDEHLKDINEILMQEEYHPINRCQKNLMMFKQLFKNRISPGDCSYYKRKNERLLQTEEKRRKNQHSAPE